MTKKEAIELIGNPPQWELIHMRRALRMLGGFFNTDEDNARLEAVEILYKINKKSRIR